jgi:hypothetical protein
VIGGKQHVSIAVVMALGILATWALEKYFEARDEARERKRADDGKNPKSDLSGND